MKETAFMSEIDDCHDILISQNASSLWHFQEYSGIDYSLAFFSAVTSKEVPSNPNYGRGAFSKEMNDERDGIYVGDR
jgi:hypothetical protein